MGSAQASLCCWERQKLPVGFQPRPPPAPPQANEPSPSAATLGGGEDDEQVELQLCTKNTFIEYREVARSQKRSHSMPRDFRPCRGVKTVKAAPLPSNTEENAVDKGQTAGFSPMDDAFEPFLTPEMVATDRIWRREVIGRLAWRKVPVRPHSCRNSCPACCQLNNNNWRLAACDPVRIPGHSNPCKTLEILPKLPERALLLSQ
ncbi:lig [Symbiodinium sp. CCMP2456]|nr:lig [Symbiodinium sp. CCMP2456]